MDIRRGIIRAFDSGTYLADVQTVGSMATMLTGVPVAKQIGADLLTSGTRCGVLFFDETNPSDACVVFVYEGAPVAWVTSALIKDGEIVEADLAFNPAIVDSTETISADWLFSGDKKLQFRDPQIYIVSLNDGHLDLVADTAIRLATLALTITSISPFIQLSSTRASGGWLSLYADDGVTNQIAIYWDSGNQLRLGYSTAIGGTGFVEQVRIDAAGRVGLLTPAPGTLLTLAGNNSISIATPSDDGYLGISGSDALSDALSAAIILSGVNRVGFPGWLQLYGGVGGGIFAYNLKSGATQAAAGAAANELWHDTDDNSIKIGV